MDQNQRREGYQPRPTAVAEAEPQTTDPQGPPPQAGTGAVTPATTAMVPARTQAVQRSFEGLMPTSIGEAVNLCTHLAESDAIPSSFRKKPAAVLTVVMAGMELGLTPIRSLQQISNIRGKLCMEVDLQLALVRKSGLLADYDEGFEVSDVTDSDLESRLVAPESEPYMREVARKILSAADQVDKGQPYGWCYMLRKGDRRPVVRVFTFHDADRVKVSEKDEDGGGGNQEKQRIPMSMKHNYRNYPQDMYPRRARSRVMDVAFSDVLAGLPSRDQAEEYAVIEGEVVRDGAPDAAALLVAIQDQDADLGKQIETAFTNLGYGPARQLQVLKQYQGDPQALYLRLRDEYARQHGRPAAPPPKRAAASHPPSEPQPAVQDAQVVDESDGRTGDGGLQARAEDRQRAARRAADVERERQRAEPEQKPAEPAAPEPEPPKGKAKTAADKFKGMPTW